MKLLTFYRQIANTLPTDHRQLTESWSTVGQQMSSRKLSFQGIVKNTSPHQQLHQSINELKLIHHSQT